MCRCSTPAAFRSFASASGGAGQRGSLRDIGARARAAQTRRLWSLVAGMSAVAGFVILMLNSFQDSLMFYITPTQVALQQRGVGGYSRK